MKPMSDSGCLDALGRWLLGRRATAPSLRLHEDLVAERARVRQVSQDLGPLRAGGVYLHAAVAEHAANQGDARGAVLDAVDRDDLLGAAEHAGLDLDALVGEGV